MATTNIESEVGPPTEVQARLAAFHVRGLFGGGEIDLSFPPASDSGAEATILIVSGQNGSGKTTVFKMIDGLLRLDFDIFRKIPFEYCSLSLSGGHLLEVEWLDAPTHRIKTTFNGMSVRLAVDREREAYSKAQEAAISKFRSESLPHLSAVEFRFLPVNRSPRSDRASGNFVEHFDDEVRQYHLLSRQVAKFLSASQIDYRRFFRDEELGVIPRLLDRMKDGLHPVDPANLLERIENIKSKYPIMRRYGLHFDQDVLETIESLLVNGGYDGQSQLVLLETYVEMQEGAQRAKDLITRRLVEFDQIMSDFMRGKTISVDSQSGISIVSETGKRLREEDLSSGEYHFLYMMVAALLCQRTGSVIAIDEPELSLHVRWQRKLISALARCAAGASPLFLFATHSIAISAEHADKVISLSPVD